MDNRDSRIDCYIARSAAFAQPILTDIRKQAHPNCPDAMETIQWWITFFSVSGPHFLQHGGVQVALRLWFWRGSLLKIETKLNEAMGQFGRIGSLANLPGNKAFARLVKAAMMLQEAGTTSPARARSRWRKKSWWYPATLRPR